MNSSIFDSKYRSVVPNLITFISLFLGLGSVKEAMHGNFKSALCLIFFASIMDGLDGRMARFLKVNSKFGAELDSLCDMVNFGVAPAILNYLWCTHRSSLGWFVAVLSVVCLAIRLARFNAFPSNKPYFIGLSAPMFAGFSLFPLAITIESGNVFKTNCYYIMLYIIFCSFLAVSRIETFSIKKITSAGKSVAFKALILTIFFMSIFKPVISVIVFCFVYALFMPLAPIKYREVDINK